MFGLIELFCIQVSFKNLGPSNFIFQKSQYNFSTEKTVPSSQSEKKILNPLQLIRK